MRIPMLTLAILLATGCNADRPADRAAAPATPGAPAADPAPTPAPAPTAPPATDAPPPSDTANTVPARFQGRYAADTAACGDPAHESRLTIEAARIAFHESSGPITRVSQGPTEVSITAELTGEGETREANYGFRLSADGNTLTDVGNGAVRQRCG